MVMWYTGMRSNVQPYYLHDIIAAMKYAWSEDECLPKRTIKLLQWCEEHHIRVYGDPEAGRFADGMRDMYGCSCEMSWTQVKKLAKTLYSFAHDKEELRKEFLVRVKDITNERIRKREERLKKEREEWKRKQREKDAA